MIGRNLLLLSSCLVNIYKSIHKPKTNLIMVHAEGDYIYMKTVTKRPTNGSSEPEYDFVAYPLLSEKEVAGGGQPMSMEVLKESIDINIKELKASLKDAENKNNTAAVREILDQSIAITLGKESLFLILSQKECDGIRFYFCKNPKGRNSVAAIGVKIKRHPDTGQPQRGSDGRVIAEDIGAEDNHNTILYNKNLKVNVLNSEVGPPYNLEEFLKGGEKFNETNNIKDDFAIEMTNYIKNL